MTYLVKNKIHSSWLIGYLSAGIILGIALTAITYQFFTLTQLVLITIVLLMLSFKIHSNFIILLMLAIGFTLGSARGLQADSLLAGYEKFYGSNVIVVGRVSEDTSIGKNGDLRLQLDDIHINGTKLSGKVWVSVKDNFEAKRSNVITVEGKLLSGFGNLSASIYNAKVIKREEIKHSDIGREIRDWFTDGVRLAIPEPQSSLGNGFLTGQRNALPETLENQLMMLGLMHVVVASGYNLTILVRFAKRAFEKTSKYLAAVSAIAMISGFMTITGFSPSMSRAGLVTGLCIVAWYFGRNVQPLILLLLAAAVTALINPSFVWGDIGWYLSFTSFAGIMILAPLIKNYFWGAKKLNSVSQIIVETMSAQIATLPIIAYIFGHYSVLALPANLLVLPLIPITMLLTFISGIAGLLLPAIASWVGAPAYFVLNYMINIIDKIANLPGSSSEMSFSMSSLVIAYSVLVFIMIILWLRTGHNFRNDNIID